MSDDLIYLCMVYFGVRENYDGQIFERSDVTFKRFDCSNLYLD